LFYQQAPIRKNAGEYGFMIRKYMFAGLTLALIATLAFLIIRSRKIEKQQESRVKEVIQESKPSPTRVLAPREIKIIQGKMALFRLSPEKAAAQSAQHEIEIRNLGRASYSGIQLRLEYLNSIGKTVATKAYSINKALSPGGTLNLSGIKIDNLPVSISDCKIIIISADLADVT
jgi:hypothetical protein